MDQDDNEETPAAYEPDSVDMDLMRLLAPFSSMVTTDKDELIRQFQTIGANMNAETASFFLEMSNWNLQAAVGCYFDTLGQPGMPSMKFLNDVTVGKGEKVTPNTKIHLKFQVQNNGDAAWVNGTYMSLKTANLAQSTSVPNEKFFVPSISCNETVIVAVQMLSPAVEGLYVTNWAMYTPNGFEFGDNISISLYVCDTGTMAATQATSGGLTAGICPIEDGGTIEDDGTFEGGGTIEDVDMWD
uniref:Nbr1 FW domain-containing protein n=1 Tax=Anopheles triannulatus TaxID=58253 RepID=A0A2M4AWW9_9DIPT